MLATSTCGIQDSPNCSPSWIGHLYQLVARAEDVCAVLSFFADCLQFVISKDAHLKELVANFKIEVLVEELEMSIQDT